MEIGGIAGLGASLSAARIEAAFTAAALRTQLEVIQDLGAQTVQLVQASAPDPAVGRELDVRI